MTRQARVHPIVVALAAAAVGASLSVVTSGRSRASAVQDVSEVEITATRLSETVHFLEPVPGLAGNLAVSAGEDGILLVDTEMMPLTARIKAAVGRIQTGTIDFMVNTHYHFDHAGGNADQYVNLGGFPYIDRDVGGNALGLRDNIADLIAMIDDETRIIPGHGPLATRADLQRYHDQVAASIAHIEGAKRSGQTLEEIQRVGLPEHFAAYTGFMTHAAWIGFVYASLEG